MRSSSSHGKRNIQNQCHRTEPFHSRNPSSIPKKKNESLLSNFEAKAAELHVLLGDPSVEPSEKSLISGKLSKIYSYITRYKVEAESSSQHKRCRTRQVSPSIL
jgi:hypothetical protein